MTTLIFAHRDAARYAPLIRTRFPQIDLRERGALADLGGEVAEADILVASPPGFSDALLARASRLKWIQTMTTGTDAILKLANLGKKVVLTSTRGIHGPQMSEMVFMHMMVLARKYPGFWEQQKKKIWRRWDQIRLYGKTAVIFGVGMIAEALAPRCKAFGMKVIGVSGTPREHPAFDAMMPRSHLLQAAAAADFFIVLAPYSRETHHILDAAFFAAMKPSAFLVNVARGGIVDEPALEAALRGKRIAGAGLDVFQTEPLPPGSPFWELENMVITPHCSGSSDDNVRMTWEILEANIECFLAGRWPGMRNVVPH